jgi:hypothetical protein
MKRVAAFVITSIVSLILGGVVGAVFVRRICDRDMGHLYVTDLMYQALAAREIYAGRSRELADNIRGKLPEQALNVEKEFRQDETRNTAFRLVTEVYAASHTEMPVEIRAILANVPPRPSREVPSAVK